MDSVEQRLAELERKISRSGLGPETYFPGSLQVVRADKDGDGDFDPYTSTSWDGDSFSTGTGTINWNTDFGVPTGAKMVFGLFSVRDSASAGVGGNNYYIYLQAKSTTSDVSVLSRADSGVNDGIRDTFGAVAVAPDGTSYYGIIASGESTLDVWIKVVAYAR